MQQSRCAEPQLSLAVLELEQRVRLEVMNHLKQFAHCFNAVETFMSLEILDSVKIENSGAMSKTG